MIKIKRCWVVAVMAVMTCVPLIAQAQDTATSTGSDLEAITIELPEAFFGGTPVDYWAPNLEPVDYKDREPFMAPKGTSNVAAGKPVTSSAPPVHGELKQVTDGDKRYARTSLVELPEGVQWVQIDLEKETAIYAILVWHFHEGKRVYFDVIVQVSNDKEFKDKVTTIYNNDCDNSAGLGLGKDNEYVEDYKGRLMDAKGVPARFVRLYTKGNTGDELNHYVEVEVFGIPKAS